MYTCVTTYVDSSLTDLYTGSWSFAHDNLCRFKVSILVPLEWRHQRLSCFGFFYLFLCLPYVLSPCHVILAQIHCCICPRSKVCIWGRTYDFWSSEQFVLFCFLAHFFFLAPMEIITQLFLLNSLCGYVCFISHPN
jgi:hypothetical protein